MNTRLTRARAHAVGLTEPAVDPDAPRDLVVELDPATLPATHARPRWVLPPALRPGAPAWIWLGIAVAIGGFVLLAVGWGQVAGETQVYLQLPYVVSASMVGLGLVVVGLAVLHIASRQHDAIEGDAQIARLVAIMQELQTTLAERDRP